MPARTRAWISRAAVVGVAAGAISVGASSAMACACGGMVGPDGNDLTVHRENAVLTWDGELETIHLQLGTQGSDTEAGLLLPTPTPAEVALGDEEMFTELAAISAPRTEERQSHFGPPALFGSGGDEGAAGSAPGGVEVLSVEDLGHSPGRRAKRSTAPSGQLRQR